MLFSEFKTASKMFRDKRVVVVGTAPSCLDNNREDIEKYDVIVRVNNYDLSEYSRQIGRRTDVYFSFFGSSVHKTVEQLKSEGVRLCMCKLPNCKLLDSKWHERNNKPYGVDFRYVYKKRKDFWFCPTFVPLREHFEILFNKLGRHMPTTGFNAVHDVFLSKPKELYITGFDFFTSRKHNINQMWRSKNHDDPYKHEPERERKLLKEMVNENTFIRLDRRLMELV